MKTSLKPIVWLAFLTLLQSCVAPDTEPPQSANQRAEKKVEDRAVYPTASLVAGTDKPAIPLVGNLAPQPDLAPPKFNTEEYDKITDNAFVSPLKQPLSTFSVDVDRAAYANVRRFLNDSQLPPRDAVRIEEMVNYFDYDYAQPRGEAPFSVGLESGTCYWNPEHYLLHIRLQGKTVDVSKLPPSNLVFLLDVSGSMDEANKLPLLKQSLKVLMENLRPEDRVAIVVYAGAAGVVLPSMSFDQKDKIIAALENLQAGGSTAGGEGIVLAYQTAMDNFIAGGNNRVILATDGDFNVGVASDAELERLIEVKREQGIFLTVLGFGMGNYKDSKMELLADKGNGNYAYVDNILEAKKVLGKEIWGTLYTIAKDVKIQIEFNPSQVKGYRLIGYENRMLQAEDFNDDQKDAGEIGSGHSVTAIYEIIPASSSESLPGVDDLVFQESSVRPSDDLMVLKLRYKKPDAQESQLLEQRVRLSDMNKDGLSDNFKFASAVAEFGLLLRQSEFKANANYPQVITLAREAKGNDANGYRAEFIRLAEMAQSLAK